MRASRALSLCRPGVDDAAPYAAAVPDPTVASPHRPAAPRRLRRPRCWLLALSVILLAGGCGGATRFEDEATPTTGRLPAGTASSIPGVGRIPASPTSTTTAAPPVTPATRQAQPATRGTTVTRAPSPAPTVSAADLAIIRGANGPPGAAAAIILRPTPATSLVVEVLEEPGAAFSRSSLDRVLADLRRYSGKPVAEVHTPLPAGSPSRRWNENELAGLADRTAKVAQGSGRFVVRILSVRGQNARSASILAVSFLGDTFATFPDRLASSPQQLATTVTLHELGHLLGLVDLYLDRGRADTENDPAGGGHSRNPGSVMFYAVDPSLLGSVFGSASDRFDAQDERDLAAIRAGAAFGSNPR